MANEPTRPLGGTNMNKVTRLRKTSVGLAKKSNNVLAVGKFMNKREVEAMNNTINVTTEPIVETVDTVEIPAFFYKAQEEREAARQAEMERTKYRALKKRMKAPTMKEIIKKKALAFIAKTLIK